MKVVMCGGGTGGHVNPALSIANEIKRTEPNAEISFIGTRKGIESRLVPRAGYPIEYVDVQGFSRKLTPKNIAAAFKALTSVSAAKKILKRQKPNIVIGTGGYASWPAVKAAAKLGIPTLIHEQNVFPGVTTRKLSQIADKVCISFEGSRKCFDEKVLDKLVLTGNPVTVSELSQAEAKQKLGIPADELYILSFGGSMGAMRVNELVFELIEQYTAPKGIRHTHATGKIEYERFAAIAKEKGFDKIKSLEICEYIYDMPIRQAAADIIISRAGAISISEFAVCGKAVIFIPSPNVAEDHQFKNASLLADAGAAVVFRESELTGGILSAAVRELAENKNKRARMEESIRKFALASSSEKIANIAKELAKGSK